MAEMTATITERVTSIVSKIKDPEDLDKEDIIIDLRKLKDDNEIGYMRVVKEIAPNLRVPLATVKKYIEKKVLRSMFKEKVSSVKRDPKLLTGLLIVLKKV
jgi:hypothetical protein